ncbi:hypothetical protein PINS_up020757 [Pythium insidiosum]|nr:hypothetical protein PINS_up020757 [Pythium insidiosum]
MPTTLNASWDPATIVLSYIIAVTGSFCTIQIMEQWRLTQHPRRQILLMGAASVALGGCGIWSMHFTGMQAYKLQTADGIPLAVRFEGFSTIASLMLPIVGVFIGLRVASRDPFFLELEQSRRKTIVAQNLGNVRLTDMLKRGSMQRKIKFVALFSNPWRILLGGVFAALGVLVMHYLGMVALRAHAVMTFNAGIVALSCVVALCTAAAAFWILFRAVRPWLLRIVVIVIAD